MPRDCPPRDQRRRPSRSDRHGHRLLLDHRARRRDRGGAVSAVEALDAHLAQIDRHNPALNAVVNLDAEAPASAREQADGAGAGDALGPLHGVPFTLKDTHETAG